MDLMPPLRAHDHSLEPLLSSPIYVLKHINGLADDSAFFLYHFSNDAIMPESRVERASRYCIKLTLSAHLSSPEYGLHCNSFSASANCYLEGEREDGSPFEGHNRNKGRINISSCTPHIIHTCAFSQVLTSPSLP